MKKHPSSDEKTSNREAVNEETPLYEHIPAHDEVFPGFY